MFLQAGGGFKMNRNFWFNFDIVHFESRGSSQSTILSPDIVNTTGWMFMPNFSKDFVISPRHQITATLGFFYLREYSSRPEFFSVVDEQGNDGIALYMSDKKNSDGGLFLSAAYKYKLNPNILIGIQLSGYVQLYLEPEAFMIGPSIEFRL